MNPRPVLIGVSDAVASTIMRRLMARIEDEATLREKDVVLRHAGCHNEKAQRRVHERVAREFPGPVLMRGLMTGKHYAVSVVCGLVRIDGQVFAGSHQAVGLHVEFWSFARARVPQIRQGSFFFGTVDQHLVLRLVQRAGLADLEDVVAVICQWAEQVADLRSSPLEAVLRTHDLARSVRADGAMLVPLVIAGRLFAGVTDTATIEGQTCLRLVTVLDRGMLTDLEVAALEAAVGGRGLDHCMALPRRARS